MTTFLCHVTTSFGHHVISFLQPTVQNSNGGFTTLVILIVTFSINAGECVENWTEIVCSYPPRIELWTLDEKLKDNKKECVKAVLYIIILKYSFYSKLPCCIRFIQTGL